MPESEKWQKPKKLAGTQIACGDCGATGRMLYYRGKGYVCDKCSGIPRRLKKIVCGCGRTLLEETAEGGKKIMCSIVSKGGKTMLTCPDCGKGRRIRGGRI